MISIQMNKLFLLLCAAFLVFVSLPGLAQDEEASSKTIVSDSKGTQRWRTSTGMTDFNIEFRGKIEVTDDDKDIKSISSDGYLEISKTVFGSKRSIRIESEGGGRIRKEYFEGRTRKEWEPAGRQWLSEILPEIVRTTTLGADGRVDRFYRQGGAKGVLSEISSMKSDYVKAHYGKLLLAKNLTNQEMPGVISGLCNSIGSDYYLSTLLKDNIGKLLVTREAGDAFFKGVRNISSDYYKAVVLEAALDKYAASPEQVKLILETATYIKSDYYLSTILTSLLNKSLVKEESLNELISISSRMSSDHYRTQVLTQAIQKGSVSKATLKSVVDATATVKSDYYKSTVLTSVASRSSVDDATIREVVTIVGNSMPSDFYSASVLNAVIKNQKLSDESFRQVTAAAAQIKSDHYTSEVLREAGRLSLSGDQIISICKATEGISSDHYVTTVLTSIAPKVRSADSDVQAAYRLAAKRIRSETYYGRALRAIE
jgi:hypothetical protein